MATSGSPLNTQSRTPSGFPQWAPAAGFALLVLTIVFLMFVIVRQVQIPCNQRALVVFIISLSSAGAVGFLGGNAIARGALPVDASHSLTVAVSGGVGTLVVIMLVGWNVYVKDTHCVDDPRAEAPQPAAVIDSAMFRLDGNKMRADVTGTSALSSKQFLRVAVATLSPHDDPNSPGIRWWPSDEALTSGKWQRSLSLGDPPAAGAGPRFYGFQVWWADNAACQAALASQPSLTRIEGCEVLASSYYELTDEKGGFVLTPTSWPPTSQEPLATGTTRRGPELGNSPASPVQPGDVEIALGNAKRSTKEVTVELGEVPPAHIANLILEVMNGSSHAVHMTAGSADADLQVAWDDGGREIEIPNGERRGLKVVAKTSETLGHVFIRSGTTTLKDISFSAHVVQSPRSIDNSTLSKRSGARKDFSQVYSLCLGPAPVHYTLVRDSVKFSLTGDRVCGSYANCQLIKADDSDVCFAFSLQGHEEGPGDGVRESTGHLTAKYQLLVQPALLR